MTRFSLSCSLFFLVFSFSFSLALCFFFLLSFFLFRFFLSLLLSCSLSLLLSFGRGMKAPSGLTTADSFGSWSSGRPQQLKDLVHGHWSRHCTLRSTALCDLRKPIITNRLCGYCNDGTLGLAQPSSASSEDQAELHQQTLRLL